MNKTDKDSRLTKLTRELGFDPPDTLWLTGCFLITAIATFLRFYWLELKPMHHDEGVNGHFLTTLFHEGVYKYDPANYHGPDLYYISLAFAKLFGLNTLSVRWSVAIFGLLTVVLAFFLKRHIGKIGSLAAALFLALSPGMVYISRYFIHEILFVFFSLAIVISIVYFIEKRRVGVFAVAWMSLILMVCFLPTSLTLASHLGKDNLTLLWTLRIIIFLFESFLIFMVMRMLIAWDNGRPIYLLLASASTVLLFATKETAFITLGTMLIACVCIWAWQKINNLEFFKSKRFSIFLVSHGIKILVFGILCFIYFDKIKAGYKWFYSAFSKPEAPNQEILFYAICLLSLIAAFTWIIFFQGSKKRNFEDDKFFEPTWQGFRKNLGNGTNLALIIIASLIVFVYLGVLFFSSFFTYPDGVKGAFEAYAIWSKTSGKDHTQNGTLAYLRWVWHTESPLIILSVLGTLIAFVKAKHRFAMFAGPWAVGLFLAYTIIPYKTPWLALSFTLPMCIIAGYAINELFTSKDVLQKMLAGILVAFSIIILGFQTYDTNFQRYDDADMPYVYAHTKRGFLGLIEKIEHYAKKSERNTDATIEVVSPDYWAMPWYTRDYKNANYRGNLAEIKTAEMIVASETQRDALVEKYSAHYKYVGTYPLRPGVELYLLVRKDLADKDAKEIYEIK